MSVVIVIGLECMMVAIVIGFKCMTVVIAIQSESKHIAAHQCTFVQFRTQQRILVQFNTHRCTSVHNKSKRSLS